MRLLPLALFVLLLLAGCEIGEIEHTGTITRIERDGGFWGLITTDSTRFRPTNLPVEFEQEGMEVEFEGYVLSEERVEGEWGIPIELTEVEVQIQRRDD
jgi:hypothetical protein